MPKKCGGIAQLAGGASLKTKTVTGSNPSTATTTNQTMKASQLIKLLQEAIEKHGDLPVYPEESGFCGHTFPVALVTLQERDIYELGKKVKTIKVLVPDNGVGW
jgi:hypothetical protein